MEELDDQLFRDIKTIRQNVTLVNTMKKGMDSYCIPKEIKSDLSLIAEAKSLNVSELIDQILNDYIKSSTNNGGDLYLERRAFPRKNINNQAVIQLNMSPRSFNYRTVTVKDISLGGLLVEFANEHAIDKQMVNENSSVEIIFNFTQEGKPISFVCKPCHIQESDNHLSMGLAFIDGSFREYKELAYQLLQ